MDLKRRMERTEARIRQIRDGSPTTEALASDSIAAHWESLPVLDKRRIITDLGTRVKIKPADMGKRPIDPDTGLVYTVTKWIMMRIDVSWSDD